MVIRRLERYIKAISGVGVCRALVTIPTLLIMFCKVARKKKMKKLWNEGRNEKMKGTAGTATFLWRSCGWSVVVGVIRFTAVHKADGFIEMQEASLIHLIIHSLVIIALL